MNLSDAIKNAQGCYEAPPKHETATCQWVIRPLLEAAGYLPREIMPEQKDQNNKYPDFTILPNTTFTWFVEAKAWHVALEDNQVIQALNYANHNGKRWVVLSNGKLWRLYDNTILGIAPEKLVSEVSLEDTDGMIELLSALTKQSIDSGQITEYAKQKITNKALRDRATRIATGLSQQLENPLSPVVSAIADALANSLGLDRVEPSEIVSFFAAKDTAEDHGGTVDEPLKSNGGDADFRMRVTKACRDLVKATPGINHVSDNGFRTFFVPAEWQKIADQSSNKPSLLNLLALWIYVDRDRVKVCLEIWPGPQAQRQQLFDYAKAHRDLFNPGSLTLYPKYSQIYRRELVPYQDFVSGDFGSVENQLMTPWADFAHSVLPKLEQAMVSA